MTVVLPDWVSARSTVPELRDTGTWNKAVNGGHTRTDRPGSRFAVEITLPPVRTDAQGTALKADLMAARGEGLRYLIEGGAMTIVPAGPAVVDGNDVQGTSLTLRGLHPNTVVRKGQFVTVQRADRTALHMVVEEVLASETGTATLKVEPELRFILSDGDAVEIDRPFIDGVLEGNAQGWADRIDRFMDVSFSLADRD